MNNKVRPGLLIFTIALPLAVGALSAMITGDMMKEYFFMNKPPLSPPSWIFPVVWTVLYIMMGFASYMVINSGADRSLITKALVLYGIQLVLNFFWSLLFFNSGLFLWAFIELIAMWLVIIFTTVMFFRARTSAGVLMVPYILWTTFAAYLNFAVYRLSTIPMPLPR